MDSSNLTKEQIEWIEGLVKESWELGYDAGTNEMEGWYGCSYLVSVHDLKCWEIKLARIST